MVRKSRFLCVFRGFLKGPRPSDPRSDRAGAIEIQFSIFRLACNCIVLTCNFVNTSGTFGVKILLKSTSKFRLQARYAKVCCVQRPFLPAAWSRYGQSVHVSGASSPSDDDKMLMCYRAWGDCRFTDVAFSEIMPPRPLRKRSCHT